MFKVVALILAMTAAVNAQQKACSASGTSPSEIQGFLGVHNKLRSSISGGTYVAKGKRMPAAKTPIPAMMSKNGQGEAASKAWEKEFQDYGWSDIKLTMAVFNSGVGHATQMAWAKSTKLGCATALCQGDKQAITVCHYKDAGNMINGNVYEPK